jgi:hypothetical protein
MTGNDLHARRKLCDYVRNILCEAFDVAATIQIDKRETARKEMVAHVNDV